MLKQNYVSAQILVGKYELGKCSLNKCLPYPYLMATVGQEKGGNSALGS